jgi:3-dehydroquinate dehydratase / shikimate dehydrogenase
MTPALLVETVTADDMAALKAARDRVSGADLVELRLDGVADLDVAAALDGRRLPVIVTCRPAWEGGRFDGSEEERQRILLAALAGGAEYVDVEWRAGFTALLAHTGGARVVLSSHDFDGVPADLDARVREMRATGAEVVKIAVRAHRLMDGWRLRDVTRDGRTVAIAMGDSGIPTRLLAVQFGSCWTYGGDGAAPGQIPVHRMTDEYRFRDVSRSTAVFALVGTHVAASRSPAMHNGWFAAAGLDAVFVPMPTPDFEDFLAFADALAVQGAAVTIPFKLHAMRHSVRADSDTRRIGASNTLRRVDGGWEATNTDVAGFLAPFAAGETGPVALEDLRGARVTVLGAGGAARAVVVGLASAGSRTTICARRPEQAREVARLGAEVGEWPPRPGSWDVLVNCTPLGGVSAPGESPLPGGPFDGQLVYDLIYRPAETPLLREARAAGCATINGWPMLQAQARKQFEWWTAEGLNTQGTADTAAPGSRRDTALSPEA